MFPIFSGSEKHKMTHSFTAYMFCSVQLFYAVNIIPKYIKNKTQTRKICSLHGYTINFSENHKFFKQGHNANAHPNLDCF